jgi:Protein of unknown function (DUF1360)
MLPPQTMLFGKIILLALAVSSISVTISKSNLFEPIRERLNNWSDFLGELIYCPYCLSHWLSILGVLVFIPGPIITSIIIMASVVALASFSSLGIIWFFIALDALDRSQE